MPEDIYTVCIHGTENPDYYCSDCIQLRRVGGTLQYNIKNREHKSKRKIIQISTMPASSISEIGIKASIFALTDDGKVWNMIIHSENELKWKKLPPIPQD